jgi:hypothetical protein
MQTVDPSCTGRLLVTTLYKHQSLGYVGSVMNGVIPQRKGL